RDLIVTGVKTCALPISGGGGGSSLKGSAPMTQAPVNSVTTSTLTPALVVSGGGLTYASGAVQYRFRVMDALGSVVADSGLVSSKIGRASCRERGEVAGA